MAYPLNAIMYWHDGTSFVKVTDHGRSPFSESVERIESSHRMADGTMRRYTVAKKRSWNISWENLPSTNLRAAQGGMTTADGGMSGEEIEAFHDTEDDAFQMQIWSNGNTLETTTVMITDFTKEIVKRGPRVDIWNLSITLTEV